MRTVTMAVLATLVLAVPGVGRAQSGSKLAIGTIRGDASRVRRQILLQVCESYDCVAASRVITNNRPDPQKLQRAGVVGYLGGAVTGEPGERRLILSLTTPTSTARKPARIWRLRLTPDGRLRPQALDRFATELDEALRGAGAAAPSPAAPPQRAAPPPPPPPPAAKAPPPRPPPPAAEPAPKPPPAVAQPAPKPPPPAEPAKAPKPRREEPSPRPSAEGRLRFAGEVGLWITNRKLSYSGAAAGADGSLRTYSASAIFVPSVRLELYPAAWAGAGRILSGIGVFADYGQSVGLKVKPPSGSSEGNHDGKLTAFDVGAVWRLQPTASSRFVLAPAVAYRSLQVTTSPAIAGLADTKPSGYELRLDAQLPVTPSLTLLGGGGYTLWTTKKELVGSVLGKGSAHGLALQAGAAYRLFGPLSLKAVFEYQSVSYSGLGQPKTTFGTASSASDSYLGGRIMLRAEY